MPQYLVCFSSFDYYFLKSSLICSTETCVGGKHCAFISNDSDYSDQQFTVTASILKVLANQEFS